MDLERIRMELETADRKLRHGWGFWRKQQKETNRNGTTKTKTVWSIATAIE